MATLQLRNVKKIYDNKVVAVQNFNLDVKDKEFIVFVGPSGCGKSTTLRMIAGLEEISDGEILIDGQVVNDLQPKDRGIAMVFQNYALYPHMSVFENMAFSLRLMRPKLSQDEIFDRVTQAAEVLGIKELLTRKPRALSGGQRQRVAIGRAMVRDSKVFLMDEPLSNLDAKLRNQMRAEIILLRKKIDSTFVYETHNKTEAMTLGDRIVIMKDGFIQQVGTPQQLFDEPTNLFVATFIGAPQMNLFKARLAKSGNEYFVELCGKKIPVTGEKLEILKKKATPEQEVTLGIRPEHFVYTEASTDTTIDLKVKVNEMMGSEIHVHAEVEGNDNVIIRIPTVSLNFTDYANHFSLGKDISVKFESKVIHLFDSEGNNLLFDSYEPVNWEEVDEKAQEARSEEPIIKDAQIEDIKNDSLEAPTMEEPETKE